MGTRTGGQLTRAALRVARTAALEAGDLLHARAPFRRRISYKLTSKDLVTEMDKRAEEIIVRRILRAFPGHDIMAEEGTCVSNNSPCRWQIDPLDGTTNYAHGYPVYCVSIGLEIEGRVEVGVVYNPNLAELFQSVRGGGAFRNGKRIAVSTRSRLDESLLATGFPYDVKTSKENNMDLFRAFAMEARAVRRAGSAAIDLCYTACGRFDGFWEMKLKSWDMAAGALIAEEAGAVVRTMSGKPWSLACGDVVVANRMLHRQLMNVIRRVRGARNGGRKETNRGGSNVGDR